MNKFNVIITPRFEKDIKYLSKKFRKIDDDVDNVIQQLEIGTLLGEVVTGLNLLRDKVYKCRVPNTSDKRGKSGGFRLIYYVVTNDDEIYLLTIYSKTEIEDLEAATIRKYIADAFK